MKLCKTDVGNVCRRRAKTCLFPVDHAVMSKARKVGPSNLIVHIECEVKFCLASRQLWSYADRSLNVITVRCHQGALSKTTCL